MQETCLGPVACNHPKCRMIFQVTCICPKYAWLNTRPQASSACLCAIPFFQQNQQNASSESKLRLEVRHPCMFWPNLGAWMKTFPSPDVAKQFRCCWCTVPMCMRWTLVAVECCTSQSLNMTSRPLKLLLRAWQMWHSVKQCSRQVMIHSRDLAMNQASLQVLWSLGSQHLSAVGPTIPPNSLEYA